MARVVHRLEGHSAGHGTIADYRDGIAQSFGDVAAQIAGHGKAKRSADRSGAMGGAKGVIGAFAAFGEARKAVLLPNGADAVAAPGQDLVRIALVGHIPDHLVAGRIEDRMERDGQFHHAQARAEVATGFGDGGDGFQSQLIRDLYQMAVAEALQIRRAVDLVQKRGVGPL